MPVLGLILLGFELELELAIVLALGDKAAIDTSEDEDATDVEVE